MSTLGVVDVAGLRPAQAERLTRRLAGKPVIEWIARRATESQRVNQVVVLIGDGAAQQALSELVPASIPVAQTSSMGAERYARLASQHDAESLLRVRADGVFVDPVLMDRLVGAAAALPGCAYASYRSTAEVAAQPSLLGSTLEWIDTAALELACARMPAGSSIEDAVAHFRLHPEFFVVHSVALAASPVGDDCGPQVLSYEYDWEHTLAVFESLGPDEHDWQRIARLLLSAPPVRKPAVARQTTCIPA